MSPETTEQSGTTPSSPTNSSARKSLRSRRFKRGKPKRSGLSTSQEQRTQTLSADFSATADTVEPTPTNNDSRYEVLDELGRGGWGVVERAIDRQLKRPVAIKKIRGSLSPTTAVRDRFLHEAVVTSQLQHPGIVPVHELGEGESGDSYYVMKLLDGKPFRQLIRETHASLQQEIIGDKHRKRRHGRRTSLRSHQLCDAVLPLLERFIDVCNAVAYAHQQGVLHRDLKPANVMIGRFGETIVVDWGLAKRVDDDSHPRDDSDIESDLDQATRWMGDSNEEDDSPRTSTGSVIGTPAYMPPEQALGDIDAMTTASDIYSLGVMLYEILVGHHPHQGRNVELVLQRVRTGEWTSAKQTRAEVPRALSAICDAAMAFDPNDRYQTAETLADEIRRFIAGDAVLADHENWLDRASRWCRRNIVISACVAGTTLTLLFASVVFGYFIHQAHQSERAARLAVETAHQESLQLLSELRASTARANDDSR